MSIALATIVIFCSFFTQAAIGFGGGLISIPLTSLFIPVSDAVSFVLIFQFLMGLIIIKTYKHIDFGVLIRLLPGTIIGSLCGILILKNIDANIVRFGLGLFILLYLAENYFKLQIFKKIILKIGGYVTGFIGGILMGVIGMGGPVYVMFLKETIKSTASFHATITTIFFLSHLTRLPASYATSLLTKDILVMSIIAFPAFLLAMWLGYKAHNKISETVFKNIVNMLLLLSAISLIAKAVHLI